MSNYIFNFLVSFLSMAGVMLVYGFITSTFTDVVFNLPAALTGYKAPAIVAFLFSALFAWVKVSE